MSLSSAPRYCLQALVFLLIAIPAVAQVAGVSLPADPSSLHSAADDQASSAPQNPTLKARPQGSVQQTGPAPYLINGVPYQRPTAHVLLVDYVHQSYGLDGFIRATVRALYTEGLDEPHGWSQDAEGYGQREASALGVNVINGNVRLGMEALFHEDLRYFPCKGCSIKRKLANALLAEVTARHDNDGHRFFTLTPAISDFSGPIVSHCLWYPGGVDPFAGVVATRTVAAARIGLHLVQEFFPSNRRKPLPAGPR